MCCTKGKHAFFVVSHIDRPHPHVHIYYNSTSLDCTRKFRDFLGSEGYKKTKYSKKYLAEHEADIAVYRAAGATMDRLLNGAKRPKMDMLKADFQKLVADKKAAYRDYRVAKKDMQEIVTAKANIDHLLGLTDEQKNKEMER